MLGHTALKAFMKVTASVQVFSHRISSNMPIFYRTKTCPDIDRLTSQLQNGKLQHAANIPRCMLTLIKPILKSQTQLLLFVVCAQRKGIRHSMEV